MTSQDQTSLDSDLVPTSLETSPGLVTSQDLEISLPLRILTRESICCRI